jgi:Fe2+ or Zn2+ uptake regulation protein
MGVTGVDDASYCDKCGSTNIEKASIDEWQSLYEKKYGFKFLNNTY